MAPPAPTAAEEDDDGGEFREDGGDEYRWRKYGQKIMKGSPFPRSYYKCTTPGCPAKKLVESTLKDGKEVTVASFRGNHTHAAPGARRGGFPSSRGGDRGSDGEEDFVPPLGERSVEHSAPEGEGKMASPPQARVKRAAAVRKTPLAQSSDEDVSDEEYGRARRAGPKKRGRKPKFSKRSDDEDGEDEDFRGEDEGDEGEEESTPKPKSSRRGGAMAAAAAPEAVTAQPAQQSTPGIPFPGPIYYMAAAPAQPPQQQQQ